MIKGIPGGKQLWIGFVLPAQLTLQPVHFRPEFTAGFDGRKFGLLLGFFLFRLKLTPQPLYFHLVVTANFSFFPRRGLSLLARLLFKLNLVF